MPPMVGTLRRAIDRKREEVARSKAALSFGELEATVLQAERARNLFSAATHHATRGHVSLIAEVVWRDRRGEWLRPEYETEQSRDAGAIAKRLAANGAAALSCVTDEAGGGHVRDIERMKEAAGLPVLRRDLVIDPWQLWESRAAGADGVVLTAEALREGEMVDMLILAQQLGLTSVLEAHSMESLLRARPHVGFPHPSYALLSINNLDLHSGAVEMGHTLRLVDLVEDTGILLSAGGVRGREDVLALRKAGVRIVLAGEELMRLDDPGKGVAAMLGRVARG
ncbi:MAG: hypothetical protein H7Y88_00915 [Phycisphaerales bacterium]|nr:hypothetical protein [Phycisphaerales bacterium]